MARLRISFVRRLLDFLFPRYCCICGGRLSATDEAFCVKCNLHLPRTYFYKNPKDNEMAQRFWYFIPIENAAALYYYHPHSPATNIILRFKYDGRWDIAEYIGRVAAKEFMANNFFEGIDIIVPMPITMRRELKRGYNQCYHIAIGVREITGLPIVTKAVKRIRFTESQTRKNAWERRDNVASVFRLSDKSKIEGKHVLVIDDVVTTGSTILSCCGELLKGGVKAISVLSIAYTHA